MPDPELLTAISRFEERHTNSVLYGADHTPRIVAIEMGPRAEIVLYQRQSSGETTRLVRPFTPWLISASRDPWESAPAVREISELRGSQPLRFLVEFASWDAFRNLTADTRDDPNLYVVLSATSQFQMWTGLTLFEEMNFEHVRRMQLDIETLSLDPTAPDAEVIMIAIRQGDHEEVLVQESGEAKLLNQLNRVFDELDPDVIEGHNLFGFDLPYLVARSERLGVRLRLGRDGSSPQIWNTQQRFRAGPVSLPFKGATIYGRHIVDTLQQIQRHDVQGNLSSYRLKDVIRELGIERADRVFVAGEEIADLWRSGQRDRETLAQYALDDVRDVDLLSRITTPTEFYQTQILPTTYQRATLAGTGRKIDDLLVRAYLSARHSIPVPEFPRDFPGGYTSVVRTGVFSPVVKADVESLYPSIMNTQNISPSSDVLGAFPILLKDLTQRRLHAKARVRETSGEQRAYWDALQGSFKILINSFFGYLGFGVGHFNDFDAAERVTLEGQRIILQVVQVLEQKQALPIEVDTDGVYFQPPPGLSQAQEESFIESIGSELGAGIRLAHDGSYAHMLSLKMKTYALLDHADHLVLKGSSLRSRRMERYLQHFIRDAARAFMTGQDEAARESYFGLAERLQLKQMDPAEIGQWAMLRRSTAEKNARLSRLLRSTQGEWQFGERVILYEREDGELGLIQHYHQDENTTVLLRKLRDTATRFDSLFATRAEFDAFFPEIQPTTNLDLARQKKPVHQLGLF